VKGIEAHRELAKTNREQTLIVHALFGKQKVMPRPVDSSRRSRD
jgi:hypothetical protein